MKIMPYGQLIEIPDNMTIWKAASEHNFVVDGACAGKGICGKCKVKIKDSRGVREVLACRHVIEEDLTLWLDGQSVSAKSKTKVNVPAEFIAEEAVRLDALQKNKKLGVAVDIGTTTVVVMLWDIVNTRLLGVKAETNPQGVFGADVITRIDFTREGDANLRLLHEKITQCICDIVKELLAQEGYTFEDISRYAVVGNTTMSHIFMNISPESLSVLPFEPVFTEGKHVHAEDVGLLPSGAEVYLLPNIAGHVGSDITAGVLTCDCLDEQQNAMYIDIGTNGEIVFNAKGRVLVCSTAAGPAFEGSRIVHGMRAADGAIEKAKIHEDGVELKTINDSEPSGICGSGIIDLISEMARKGIVKKNGRLSSESELVEKGISENIAKLCVEENKERKFLLSASESNPVYITQNDIREIQLAKGAIATGWELLLRQTGTALDDLDKVYIAGAFGSHIDLENAKRIGLIPDIADERIISLGNAAGTGASMGLLSDSFLGSAEELRKKSEHIELSLDPQFLGVYTKNMRI